MVEKRVSDSIYISFSIISYQVLQICVQFSRSDNYPHYVNKVRTLKLSSNITSKGQMNAP